MKYEAFKLKNFILADKRRIYKKILTFNEGYNFIIDDIGANALTIIGFFNYTEIFNSNGTIEMQLMDLILKDARSAVKLKNEALYKKNSIFSQKIDVYINEEYYSFEIDGVGPQAIRISREVTYDDIVTSEKPLESILREITDKLYAYLETHKNFLNRINREWQKDYEYKEKLRAQTLKEEEIRAQKQKELEEFLNS